MRLSDTCMKERERQEGRRMNTFTNTTANVEMKEMKIVMDSVSDA